MLARKPVIAADAGGPREIVRPGSTGLLFPDSNTGALVAALDTLLSSPDKASGMGLAGRKVAESAYSLERVRSETESVIRSVLTA
jgi:glycosyltransferase involved in cell wall biosynthesis